ncbi:hypothetical protein T08_13475 [Trichinella sp. T8]|nr:hypothetical protein T08_13475 [Trichinella sp. T8]
MIYMYRCDFSVAIFWLQFSADHWGQFTTQHRLYVYLYTKRSDPSRRADFAISAGSRRSAFSHSACHDIDGCCDVMR